MRYLAFIAAAFVSLALGGCPPTHFAECSDESSCDRFAGGVCVASTVNGAWCAYPDGVCSGGLRYSDRAGDGLAGECVADVTDGSVDSPDAPIDAGLDAPLIGNWTKIVGGPMMDSVEAVAVAADGSVVIAVNFQGTVDLGGGPLTSAADSDFILARISPTGEHIWSRRYGGAGTQSVTQLRLTSGGDIVVAGAFRDASFTLGTSTLTNLGMLDVFLARFSASGDPLWARHGGGAGLDLIHDLEVDSADNIVVCGDFDNTATFFGGTSLVPRSIDVFVARVSGAGAVAWAKRFGNAALDDRCGVGVIANGDVILAGDYIDTFSAGGANFTSTTRDLYFTRLAAADGAHVWSFAPTGTGQERAADVDGDGMAFYAIGSFDGTLSLGGAPLAAPTSQDVFVAKFDATSQAHVFSTKVGGPGMDWGYFLDVRPGGGGVAAGGVFIGTVNFGGTTVTSNGDYDAFVADVDPGTGAVTGVRSVGGTSRDVLTGIVNRADHSVISGSFAGSITILGDTYNSRGLLDGFVVRIRR